MANWPKISIDMTKRLDMCFACGQKNLVGLKLQFVWDGETATGEFMPTEVHQSWSGIVHGGIIQCLLDEVMSYATKFNKLVCVTAEMHSRFRRPALVGEPLVLTSSITKMSRKLINTRATIALKDGTTVAEATATHFVVGPETATSNTQ